MDFEKTILSALASFSPEIDVTPFVAPVGKGGLGWSVDETSRRYEDVLWNNPQIFYVSKTRSLTWRKMPDGSLADVRITGIPYAIGPGEYAACRARLEEVTAKAVATIGPEDDDRRKALLLHDFLRSVCAYDRRGLTDKSATYRTSYGALVLGRAVCEGYAMAYRHLLDRVGLESREVVSEAMNHCWNSVKIGGAWYHVDVTADDPTFEVDLKLRERWTAHRYFLLTDAQLRRRGYRDWVVRPAPAADASSAHSRFRV